MDLVTVVSFIGAGLVGEMVLWLNSSISRGSALSDSWFCDAWDIAEGRGFGSADAIAALKKLLRAEICGLVMLRVVAV